MISKVNRKGPTFDTFVANVTSKGFKNYKLTPNSKVTISILYGDAYGKTLDLDYVVSEYDNRWYVNKVVFAPA